MVKVPDRVPLDPLVYKNLKPDLTPRILFPCRLCVTGGPRKPRPTYRKLGPDLSADPSSATVSPPHSRP